MYDNISYIIKTGITHDKYFKLNFSKKYYGL